jgi:hypothetical protein
MRRLPVLSIPFIALSFTSACSDDDPVDESASTEDSESIGPIDESDTEPDPETETETETGDTDEPIEPPVLPLCGTQPPAGATLAPALPSFSGPGSCPVLETGPGTINVMETDHGEREFFLVTPSDYEAGEQLPVVFMYHWLGGDAVDFYNRAEAQHAADYYRFIAIIPEGRTSGTGVPFRWPFSIIDDESLMDEEYSFHDNMLACVHEQFGVDKECVSTMGVSAGAMFSAMLASRQAITSRASSRSRAGPAESSSSPGSRPLTTCRRWCCGAGPRMCVWG